MFCGKRYAFLYLSLVISGLFLIPQIVSPEIQIEFTIGIKAYSMPFWVLSVLQFLFALCIHMVVVFFNSIKGFLSDQLICTLKWIYGLTMIVVFGILVAADSSKYYFTGVLVLMCLFLLCIIILVAFANWLMNRLISKR